MAMISRGSKRRYVEGGELDRLTALPVSVKHQIQERLSMEEAARMSILSRPWRHVWSSIPFKFIVDKSCNVTVLASFCLLSRRQARFGDFLSSDQMFWTTSTPSERNDAMKHERITESTSSTLLRTMWLIRRQ
ncbi:hypothetical protein FXO37_00419 [Capsicum annuum]|nr:hypothetical protein FXO37_00419 [Capsicum annuum]